MIEVSEKELDERFAALPKELKQVLLSDHMQTVIEEIGTANGLSTDAMANLDNVTTYVLVGVTHPKDFIRSISETLSIEADKATAIANEINERVFRPVRDELRALHGLETRGDSGQRIGDREQNTKDGPLLTPPRPPRPRPLDAELSENAGLRPTVPTPPKPRPLDAELSASMRKPPVPVPPPQRPRPTFAVPPPPLEPPVAQHDLPQTGQAFSSTQTSGWQKAPSPKLEAQSFSAPTPPAPPAPKPRVFENNFGENHEENLSREEILREIENPSSSASQPSRTFGVPLKQPPKQYNTDPYREPFN